jgi:hypothetical protein
MMIVARAIEDPMLSHRALALPPAAESMVIPSGARLRRWTQIKQKAALKRWLRENKIAFMVDAEGWPITTSVAIQRALDADAVTTPRFDLCEAPAKRLSEARGRGIVPRSRSRVTNSNSRPRRPVQ